MLTPPSWKSTVPVLVPDAGAVAVTVAVKVTFCPTTEGLIEEASEVLVLSLFTVRVRGADVLELKLVSPLYTAVMRCAPAENAAAAQVAVPWTATGRAPQPAMVTPRSWKLTVPVLVPDAG